MLLLRASVFVLVVTLAGCAAKGPYSSAPPVLQAYSSFIVGITLYEDADGCHEITRYANGRVKHEKEPPALCTDAALWSKAVASVPKPAPPAAPAPGN